MFIPIIPSVPNTKIINKTIIYSDTVLSLKEKGENLKITTIPNITEYNFEECLRIIFESNPNVIFNTIQYSKQNKKLYFYTNENISINEWKDRNTHKCKPINSTTKILEEIKNILTQEVNIDPNNISLYDVSKLMKEKNFEYEHIIDSYEENMEYMLENKYGRGYIKISDFSYKKNELEIKVTIGYLDTSHKIVFSKKDGDLYIVSSKTIHGQDILILLGNELSKIYDKLLEYKEYKTTGFLNPISINSNFKIDLNIYHTSIFNEYKREFDISSYSYKDGYDYTCNSNNIINVTKGNEDELFKRIFVRIEDCPEWTRNILYERRKNQLIEQQKNEEQRQKEEQKKQKILELKRKLFPFLKNK